MDKLDLQTPNFTDENIEKLAALFPNCVTEASDAKGKITKVIDFDLLKQELSDNIVDGPRERYQINWPGKREALISANTPISKTLRPCREESEQRDEEGGRLVANLESNGRYHSDWLSMMYRRLKLARNLLRKDGVIFISLDEGEVSNLKKMYDEIYGDDNFYTSFIWQKRSGSMDSVDGVSVDHEYVLCYGKNKQKSKGVERTFDKYENPDNDPRGPWISDNLSAGKAGGNVYYEITDPKTGNTFLSPKSRYWPYNPTSMEQNEEIHGKSVYFVDEDTLAACFEDGLDEAFVKELAGREVMRVVFKDSGFAQDDIKSNVEQIFKQLSPETEVKVI